MAYNPSPSIFADQHHSVAEIDPFGSYTKCYSMEYERKHLAVLVERKLSVDQEAK